MTAPFALGQVLWSVEDGTRWHSSGYDMNGEPNGSYPVSYADWKLWTVVKLTPRGAWAIDAPEGATIYSERIWVGTSSKRVADTKERAQALAIRRRSYHIRMCRQRLELAEQRLRLLKGLDTTGPST